jgi:hypothetical protein
MTELFKKSNTIPKLLLNSKDKEELISYLKEDNYLERENYRDHCKSIVISKEVKKYTELDDKILDIGCSSGRDLSQLHNRCSECASTTDEQRRISVTGDRDTVNLLSIRSNNELIHRF